MSNEALKPIDKFSVGEVSKVLRVSVRTLHRWDANGKLKAYRNKRTQHRYYTRQQIEAFTRNRGKSGRR